MKSSATELMKKLKFIQTEINDIHNEDVEKSFVPVKDNGEPFESEYDFASNRARIKELHHEERDIKRLLNRFNTETVVIGYDFSIAEGLVRIAQLKGEITVLTNITRGGKYSFDSYRTPVKKATFDVQEAKELLRQYQRELSALQVAVDKTNLNSTIEY